MPHLRSVYRLLILCTNKKKTKIKIWGERIGSKIVWESDFHAQSCARIHIIHTEDRAVPAKSSSLKTNPENPPHICGM